MQKCSIEIVKFFPLFLSYQMEYLVEYSFGSSMKLILHYFKLLNLGILELIFSKFNVLLRWYVNMKQYMYNRSNSYANKILKSLVEIVERLKAVKLISNLNRLIYKTVRKNIDDIKNIDKFRKTKPYFLRHY